MQTAPYPQAEASLSPAQALIAAGQFGEAETALRRILAAQPGHQGARALLAAMALHAGHIETAIELAGQALAGDAAVPDAARVLGMALLRNGDLLPAAQLLRHAVAAQPDVAGLRMELGHAEVGLGRSRAALAQYTQAFRIDRNDSQAQLHFIQMLEQEFRAGLRLPPRPSAGPRAPSTARVSVIVCSIDSTKFDRVTQCYRRLLAEVPHEIIRIGDARSLCEGYNRGVAQATGSVLVFSHDDIEILTEDFADRLLGHLEQHDLIGVVGSTRMAGTTWIDGGWPHSQGRVVHHDRPQGRYELSVYRVAGAVSAGAQAFDGLFFAARRAALERVKFDQSLFDGFHAYDLDFSFTAYQAGLRLAVVNDILIAHDSRGNFGERYRHYAARFATKHAAALAQQPRGPRWPIATVSFDSAQEVSAFAALHLALVQSDRPDDLLHAMDAARPAALHPNTLWWNHLDSTAGDSSAYHDSGNHDLLGLLTSAPTCGLEIGCGAGGLGARLKTLHPQARYYGVELNRAAAQRASSRIDGVWQGRVEDFDPAQLGLQQGQVDLLVLGDVLEHLYDPWRAMLALRPWLSPSAQVLISIPNVRNLALLAETAEGDWRYQAAGLLDITHIRFFTLREFRRLLAQTGFEVRHVECVIDGRLAPLFEQHKSATGTVRAVLGRLTLDKLRPAEFQELCSIQFRIAAAPHGG